MSYEKSYELETERLKVLADAQVKAIEAKAIEAKTVEQHLSNVRLGMTLKEYRICLRNLHNRITEREHESQKLKDHSFHLSQYGQAEGNERQRVWESFRVILRHAPASVVTSWSNTVIDTVLALKSDYWIFRSIGGQPTKVVLTCEPNVLALIGLQQDVHRQATVKFGTYPYVKTLEAFEGMKAKFNEEANNIQKDIEDIRKGTYDLWGTRDLIKLTGDAK